MVRERLTAVLEEDWWCGEGAGSDVGAECVFEEVPRRQGGLHDGTDVMKVTVAAGRR